MISIRQEVFGFCSEVVREFRYFAYYAKGTEGCLWK